MSQAFCLLVFRCIEKGGQTFDQHSWQCSCRIVRVHTDTFNVYKLLKFVVSVLMILFYCPLYEQPAYLIPDCTPIVVIYFLLYKSCGIRYVRMLVRHLESSNSAMAEHMTNIRHDNPNSIVSSQPLQHFVHPLRLLLHRTRSLPQKQGEEEERGPLEPLLGHTNICGNLSPTPLTPNAWLCRTAPMRRSHHESLNFN